MSPRTTLRLGASLAALLAAAFVGCSSDDDNPAPSDPTYIGGSAGAAGAAGAGAGGAGAAGVAGSSGSSGQAGDGGTAGAAGQAGAGGEAGQAGTAGAGGEAGAAGGGGAAGNCDGANGCYACKPVTLTQHLNQCTDSTCVPFDNAARLPLYDGGNLPPIP